MTESRSLSKGLSGPCLSLCAINGESHDFLIGTCKLREHNEIYWLSLDEDSQIIIQKCVKNFDSPICQIESMDNNIVAIITENDTCTIGKITECDSIETIQYINENKKIHQISWPENDRFYLIIDDIISEWKGGIGDYTQIQNINIPNRIYEDSKICFDIIKNSNIIVTGCERNISICDIRTNNNIINKNNAHENDIKDISIYPNISKKIVTVGEDCKIKFWDIRNMNQCVTVNANNHHRHWITTCCINPLFDDFIVTAGTDQLICLWKFTSQSSNVINQSCASPTSNKNEILDTLICKWGDSETSTRQDSIYKGGVAWSKFDPWIIASVGWDGVVSFDSIPREEKYKILL
eukprot:GHVL01028298.1.p1 GENE.GHVL01028298.1~~GHVL01028298.1.p1  ORF type:complete len:351 (+),score=99.44 GHVL01028298.1:115-1167(+)